MKFDWMTDTEAYRIIQALGVAAETYEEHASSLRAEAANVRDPAAGYAEEMLGLVAMMDFQAQDARRLARRMEETKQ